MNSFTTLLMPSGPALFSILIRSIVVGVGIACVDVDIGINLSVNTNVNISICVAKIAVLRF